MKIIKWNLKFPYRTLGEIYSRKSFIEELSQKFIYVNDTNTQRWSEIVLGLLYDKYIDRYPYEQDEKKLFNYLTLWHNTYFEPLLTYITIKYNNMTTIDNFNTHLSKGNTLKYKTKSGMSASPYNLLFDNVDNIQTDDNLSEKSLSETVQERSRDNTLEKLSEILSMKSNGEINNYLNSFNSLFSQINLNEYIENNLSLLLTTYKDIVNDIIDNYNKYLPKLKTILKGEN